MVKKKEKSLKEMFEEFILEKECTSISVATVGVYRECFERFIRDTSCNYVSYEDVLKWISMLKSKGMSMHSVNHYLRGFRIFVYWCMRKGYIDEFKIHLQRCQETKLKMVSDEDLGKILGKPSTELHFRDHRSYAIICFIMGTGARASTVLSIKKDDIDWKNREITLVKLKNKSVAIIPMSITLEKVLKVYLSTWDITTTIYESRSFADC